MIISYFVCEVYEQTNIWEMPSFPVFSFWNFFGFLVEKFIDLSFHTTRFLLGAGLALLLLY
jgi:hypothetical protein